MRVAFLNTYGNGSTGKIVDLLKEKLLAEGYEARSYYSREYCATPETSERIFSKPGFYFDALMTRVFDNHGLNSSKNTRRLIQKLEQYKPDIIHIHNLHGYWINYKMLFTYIKKQNINIVLTLHDCWAFTGHCAYFEFAKCNKWVDGCYRCIQKHKYPMAFIFDNSRRNFISKKTFFTLTDYDKTIIAVPSKWLKEIVGKTFLNKYKCVVINNGIDNNVFKYRESNLRKKYNLLNKVVVLSVANYWDERKGLTFIYECAKKRIDWMFVYIGEEKKRLGCESLPNLIHIERTESKDELAEWYSTADVFLNPTLEDNYPTTNLESISCETPVVTFNTGGSPESVIESGFGVVVLEKTVDSLVEGIQTCLKGDLNTLFDKSFLSSSKMSDKYLELYKSFFSGGYYDK